MDCNDIVLSHKDIEIYQSDIDMLCDDYINSLPIPDLIYSKSNVFLGLLDYIYKRLIKPLVKTENGYNNDYSALDKIFYGIYIPVCFRYNKTPTVIAFTSFCHIDYNIILDIKSGVYHNNGLNVNNTTHNIIKKWFAACETSLVNKTADENGIGSIFLLKSVYQYTDQQPQVLLTGQLENNASPEEITAKYQTAKLPEKPDI